MGFFARKSFGKGPFRVTISNRGVSTSVGTKGYRVGYYASKKRSSKKAATKITAVSNDDTKPVRFVYLWLLISIFTFIPASLLCILEKTRTVGIIFILLAIIEFLTYKKNKRLEKEEK